MAYRDIHSDISRLDHLFKVGQNLPREDNELVTSHWGRYLCILTSAFIEQSIKWLFLRYAKERGNVEVVNCIERYLNGMKSINHPKVIEIASSFDAELAENIEKRTTLEMREAVNSVVANRHNLAHGKDVGITFVDMVDYYRDIKNYIKHVSKAMGF